jgi:hypothetical protein
MNNNSTFAYVHTESGPVKPAKAVPIETMKNIVASIQGKHVRGEKGTNWADLAKKVNKDCNPHGYTTIQTILNKALTEAAAQAVGQSLFRLDLGNVVCDSAHAKFKISRRNHSVIVDMLYPNDNGNITIRYNVDDVAEKMFELSLDSEHYINGFGRTVIECCDAAIKEAEEMTEEDDIYSTDEFGYQPIMSADMRGLLKMTNAIMESDFGEADFAAPAPDAGGMDAGMGGMDAGMGGGADMGGAAGGGAASLGGDVEKPEDEVNFADACLSQLSTPRSQDSSQNGSFTRLTSILADKMAMEGKKNGEGVPLTGKQVRDGTQGISVTMDPLTQIRRFQEFYPRFKGNVYAREMEAFKTFLETNDVNTALEFEAWLLSNRTMQELAQRKGEEGQGTTEGDGMDNTPLPPDGTEAPADGMDAGMGGDMGMGGAPAGGGFDMGGAAGGFDMGGDMGMGADMGMGGEAGAAGGAPDINDIGEVDKISENTSEELPNLGGESAEEAPVDENAAPA